MLPYIYVDPAAQGRAVTTTDVGVNQVAFGGRLRPLAAAEIEFGPAAPPALRSLRPRSIGAAIEVQDGAFVLGVSKPPGGP